MNLVVHIFRKDVRRLWIEILVSLAALLIYFARQWLRLTPEEFGRSNVNALALLVLLSWVPLVVRLIQAEPLVGQRQFWATRPYTWRQLLGAKLLFIVVCIATPLGLLQIALLAFARVPITPALPLVLFIALATIGLAILPFMATAALTRTLTQSILLIVALLIFGVATIAFLVRSHAPVMPNPVLETVLERTQLLGFSGLVVLGIVLQYWRRNLWLGAVCLLAAVSLVWIVPFFIAIRRIMNHTFPLSQSDTLLTLVPHPQPQPPVAELSPSDSTVGLSFRFAASRLRPDVFLNVDAKMISIQMPDRTRWESKWRGSFNGISGTDEETIEADVPRSLYERAKSTPVDVQFSFALSEFHVRNPQIVQVQKEFYLPAVGFCWMEERSKSAPLVCRTSVSAPKFLSAAPNGVCNGQTVPERRRLSQSYVPKPLWMPLNLCALARPCGSQTVIISALEFDHRYRVTLNLGSLRLADYRAPDSGISFDLREMWQ